MSGSPSRADGNSSVQPWAVWLLNKRVAVPAVGMGKRWLPGTRGSRLPAAGRAGGTEGTGTTGTHHESPPALTHPSLSSASKPSHPTHPWGWFLCPTLCSAPGAEALPYTCGAPAGHVPMILRIGCGTESCPSHIPCPEISPPAEHDTLQVAQVRMDGLGIPRRMELVTPLVSLSVPPPLLSKTPVLSHHETKRNVHCILVSWPTLPFVIHQTRHGAWHCTSLQTKSLRSPGMREEDLRAPCEGQVAFGA